MIGAKCFEISIPAVVIMFYNRPRCSILLCGDKTIALVLKLIRLVIVDLVLIITSLFTLLLLLQLIMDGGKKICFNCFKYLVRICLV